MEVDETVLCKFEKGLNPRHLESSKIPARILGFGEISAIFSIEGQPDIAYKRMPIFNNRQAAETYSRMYHQYCRYLTTAGLTLPGSETCIIEVPDKPVVLYIAQQRLSENRLCHRLIHTLDHDALVEMISLVVSKTDKVWKFNAAQSPSIDLAIDGQLSNWALVETGNDPILYYIDTSTPLFRLNGIEQQNPELMLQSAPGFLRWIIRLFFLDAVMTRYYVPQLVYTDLAANLFKEQAPELIPDAVNIINQHLKDKNSRLSVRDVEKYYKEDKRIWRLFLSLKKMDRWFKTTVFKKPYEFILPEKIDR